jgi:putative DNA primase/helicase
LHVALAHGLAAQSGIDGVVSFTRIEAKNVHTERFAIGDVDYMVDCIVGYSRNPGVNIYMPWVVWRKGLGPTQKGAEADVRAVLALVGDLDSDKGKTVVSLDGLPLKAPYVVETSAGNYHATFPPVRALSMEEAKPIAEALSDAIGGDAGTKDMSHVWRIPGTLNWPCATKLARGRPRDPQRVTVKLAWNGELVAPEAIAEATKSFVKPKVETKSPNKDGDAGAKTFKSLPPELQKMVASPPYAGEDRSATAMSVFGKLWHRGWSVQEIMAAVEPHPQGFVGHYKGKSAELEKDIARCFAKLEADADRDANEIDPDSNLSIITVKAGKLSSLATKAEDLLISAKVPVYQRSDNLVRPIIQTVDASRGRKTRIAILKALDTIYLRDLLGRHGRWAKEVTVGKNKVAVAVDPPTAVASTLLARVGDWTFPAIAGVVTTPTMRPDGSLLVEQGFDEATRLLLVEPPAMPAIPDEPTMDDARAALALLEGLLAEFPFVDDVSKAVALSAIVTAVCRGAFTVAPLHASRAPKAGSGKSFVWDIVAAIAVGHLMPVITTGASNEELEKRLGTALMRGQPLMSIDNISGELGGDFLCQAIERPVVDVRVLGKSELVRCEARGTTLFATGNNFSILGDVCRRVIISNLDAELERPELRQFSGDPVETVLKNRGLYIAAALTICRAYVVAGRPNLAKKLASFEGWSDTIRSALMWLGIADPVASMDASKAEDPEAQELIAIMDAWKEAIRHQLRHSDEGGGCSAEGRGNGPERHNRPT